MGKKARKSHVGRRRSFARDGNHNKKRDGWVTLCCFWVGVVVGSGVTILQLHGLGVLWSLLPCDMRQREKN